ncbi:MAG: FAD-dependent oxidoreductase, partial [Gammaproteobacteria bacterium]|nr:FAD-dependent oxidoreductase [Gammaproteobacteria bacterium]
MDRRSPRLSRRSLLIGGASALAAGGTAAIVNAAAPLVLPETPRFGINDAYWSLALPAPNPPPERDLRADVIVIGGGFTGLSTAYYLRQVWPQADVVVLEAARCGNGAS